LRAASQGSPPLGGGFFLTGFLCFFGDSKEMFFVVICQIPKIPVAINIAETGVFPPIGLEVNNQKKYSKQLKPECMSAKSLSTHHLPFDFSQGHCFGGDMFQAVRKCDRRL
jgi:hypothetical protein